MDHPSFGGAEENSLISIFSKKAARRGRRSNRHREPSTEFECPLMALTSFRRLDELLARLVFDHNAWRAWRRRGVAVGLYIARLFGFRR
jgi:hypothetical protein